MLLNKFFIFIWWKWFKKAYLRLFNGKDLQWTLQWKKRQKQKWNNMCVFFKRLKSLLWWIIKVPLNFSTAEVAVLLCTSHAVISMVKNSFNYFWTNKFNAPTTIVLFIFNCAARQTELPTSRDNNLRKIRLTYRTNLRFICNDLSQSGHFYRTTLTERRNAKFRDRYSLKFFELSQKMSFKTTNIKNRNKKKTKLNKKSF